MVHRLKAQGYHVQNPEFSTRSKTIAELVRDTIPQAVQACGNQRQHFVTHSLGEIMVRLIWLGPNPRTSAMW